MAFFRISAGKRLLGVVFFTALASAIPLCAQTSITSNDGGTGTAGNLYEAVTAINGTASGGNVTLDISGSNLVTLGQALPTVSQSLTFLGTPGTDVALGIVTQSDAEGNPDFNQNLSLANGVSLGLSTLATGGAGDSDLFMVVDGNLSMGATASLSVTGGSAPATGLNYSGGGTGISGTLGSSLGSDALVSTGNWSMGVSSSSRLSGGAGGSVTVLNSGSGIAVENGVTTGLGGSAAITASSLVLDPGDVFSLSSGAGGSVSIKESGSDIAVVLAVLAGAGGETSAEMGSVSSADSAMTFLGGAGGSVSLKCTGGDATAAVSGNVTAGSGQDAFVTAGSVSLSGSSLEVSGGAGGTLWVNVSGGGQGIIGNGTAGNGGSAVVSLGNLTMNAGSTFTATGGSSGAATAVLDSTSTAASGTLTNGTAGSALVILGSLNGAGSVSLGGSTASLWIGSGDFSGAIAGTGSLVVSGPGTLILDGVNTYTGPTTVSAGVLAVGMETGTAAQIAGNAVVSSGATLSGFGQVAGTVTNNGLVTPGSGNAGTLTVGNYSQGVSGALAIGVSPTQSSSLSVLNTATLGGALTVTATGNFGVKYTYQFLTASNDVTGRFANFGYDLPSGLTPFLSYGNDDITLTLLRTNTDFSAWAKNGNEQAVATALNNEVANASGDMLNKMNALYTMPSGQAGVLEQLGGVVYTALPNLALENTQYEAGLLMDRMSEQGLGGSFGGQAFLWNPGPYADAAASDADSLLKPKESKGYWLEQLDSFGTMAGNSEVSAFNQASYGVLGGYETKGVDGLTTGFALGYNHTNLTSQGADGTAGVDDWQGDFYGNYNFDDFSVAAILGYGFNQYQVNRPIGAGIQADGSFTGNQVTAALQLAAHPKAHSLNPEVSAGLRYAFVETAAFTERNADSYDLSVPETNAYSLRPYLGLGLNPKVNAGGLELDPILRVTMAREVLTPSAQQDITLAGAPESPFTISGVTPETTILGAQCGLGVRLDSHLKLQVAYDGYFGGNLSLNTVSGGLNLGF